LNFEFLIFRMFAYVSLHNHHIRELCDQIIPNLDFCMTTNFQKWGSSKAE